MKFFVKDVEKEEDKTLYRDKATQFSDCYDVTNPLTSKQGKIRLLEIQIEDLGKFGDEMKDQVKALEDQKNFVTN